MAFYYISTKEQLRQLLPTAADVKLEDLQPYFARAEFQLLRPVLGQALLTEIRDNEDNAVFQQLVALLAPAVATYGYYIYTAPGQVVATAHGPRRETTTDQKPLNEKELAQLQETLRAQASAQLDEALVHLESHPGEYAAWHSSKWCTILRGSFFATADDLARYATGEWTRCRFTALWPALNAAQLRYLRPLLGRKLLVRLLDEQELVAHSEVVDLARTALAGLAIVHDDVAREAASRALEELRDVLQQDLTTWPEFEDSPAYRPPYQPADQSNNFYSGF